MKKAGYTVRIILAFFYIFIIALGYRNITVAADYISENVYHILEVDKDTVLGGEELEVTVKLKNIQAVPTENKAIQTYLGILHFDSTKFDVLRGEFNNITQTAPLDKSVYEIGEYKSSFDFPGYEYTAPHYVDVSLFEEYQDYIQIQIQFSTNNFNLLTEDYDVIKIKFTAKENVSGSAAFSMTNSIGPSVGGYAPFGYNDPFPIDNTHAEQVVSVISGNAKIDQIYIRDLETNIEYNAHKIGINYEVVLPKEVLHIEIVVITKSPSAVVTGDGIKVFDEPSIQYLITVTADDSTTTNEVTLLVREELSNNDLVLLELLNGEFLDSQNSIELDPEVNVYNFDVKFTNSLTLFFHPTPGSNAIIKYEGNQTQIISLDNLIANNSYVVNLEVMAENGSIRTYLFTFNIHEENTDISLEYVKTDLSDDVTTDNNEYFIKHKYSSLNNVRIIVKPTNRYALVQDTHQLAFEMIEDNGEIYYQSTQIALSPGVISRYTIIVTSGSNTAEYIVNLSFDIVDEESKLAGIKINGTEIQNFDSNKYEYSIGVFPYNISSINIEATPISKHAIIEKGVGEIDLSEGSNVIIISVKSQPGYYGEMQKITQYVLSYYRESKLNDETALDTILIDGVSLADFNNSKKEYIITVPYHKNNITIHAILSEESIGAKIDGDLGYLLLDVGENIFKITVTSESGLYNDEFLIKINRDGKSIDTSLNKVLVDDNEASFIDGAYVYNVDYKIENVYLNAITNNEKAQVTGLGRKDLVIGENKFIITVIAEDEDYKTDYEVKIIRRAPSTNGKLKTIKIDDTEVANFDPNQLSYTYSVGYEVLSITLELETLDLSAKILPQKANTVEQPFNLSVGLNTLTINVEAEDGSITTYQLMVTRNVSLSKDTSLKELYIEGFEPFTLVDGDERITTFNLVVPYSKDEVKVIATANSPTSFVVGATNYKLNVGANQIDVVVFAEDKNVSQVYRIFVFREGLSNNNYLNDISIKEVPNFEFIQSKQIYYINLEEKLDSLTFMIETAHNGANIEVSGNENLSYGINPIEIIVTAADGSKRSYLIFVTVGEPQSPIDPNNPQEPQKPTDSDVVYKAPAGLIVAVVITSLASVGSVGYIVLNVLRKRS